MQPAGYRSDRPRNSLLKTATVYRLFRAVCVSGLLTSSCALTFTAGGLLLHDHECKIIPVAAFVTHLEGVACEDDRGTVGEVAEGATNQVCARIADEGKNQTGRQSAVDRAVEIQGCTTVDGNS